MTNDGLLGRIEGTLDDLSRLLATQQAPDGSWRYLLEGSVLPDAYALILEVLFPPTDGELIGRLAEVIARRQLQNGGWELYPDHPGDLSTTLEAYLALRLAGRDADDPVLRRARGFIESARDEQHLSNLTRVTFAALGIVPWSAVPALPAELILLPPVGPFSIYDLVSFTRVHVPAMMTLAALEFTRPLAIAPEIRDLLAPAELSVLRNRDRVARLAHWLYERSQALGKLSDLFRVRPWALAECRRFMLERIEPDGTVGSYILSTAFSMLALEALGREEDRPQILRMKKGLRSLIIEHEGEPRMQPCSSTVWDTALNLAEVRRLGARDSDPVVQRAATWLLDREITSFPDLQRRSRRIGGGAWGFQAVNRFYPDVDDTCAVLDAIRDLGGAEQARACAAFVRGVDWVFQMQNRDGGWSAFDVDCGSPLLEGLPFNDMRRAMTDPSSADMTGRTMMFVATLRDLRAARALRRARAWLDRNQEADGSFWGRWGISYLYGTWAALLGYAAVGVSEGDSPLVDRACAWLRKVQNADGGWGESCRSDEVGHFIGRPESTPSQTAWALEGLVAVGRAPWDDPAVLRGARHLLDAYVEGRGWLEHYPTGAGFAGKLYLYYHNYRNLWPSRTLSRLARVAAAAQRSA